MGSLKYDKSSLECTHPGIQDALEVLCTGSGLVGRTVCFHCRGDTRMRSYAWDSDTFFNLPYPLEEKN